MYSSSTFPESPGLWEARRYPVTAGIAVAALLVSLAGWMGIELPFLFDIRLVVQPWRVVTSMLPHGDLVHFLFNLCWLWAFGTALERALGPWRYAALVAGLESVSAAAEYALLVGGAGLSGVVYGFFGFLWARRRDPQFQALVQPATAVLFVVWFFVCLALTLTGVWLVANVSHAAGAGAGFLLGRLGADTVPRREARLAVAAGLVALALAGASILRPYVNLTPAEAAVRDGYAGYRALLRGQDLQAVALLGMAVRLDAGLEPAWFNLEIALRRLGLHELATRADAAAARLRQPVAR
jgi:membrane associated rhomboid family serine protease